MLWICFGFLIIDFPILQSPDGVTVASIAGDETMRLWNVFGTTQLGKPGNERKKEPFSNFPRIR